MCDGPEVRDPRASGESEVSGLDGRPEIVKKENERQGWTGEKDAELSLEFCLTAMGNHKITAEFQ